MAKKMVHIGGGGGIGKKRQINRRKKKSIHKVIDYLLSDCYLFAPLLISPSPINSHATPTKGIEIRERIKDRRSLVKKIGDYLKSDCYMYASLLPPPHSLGLRVKGKGETECVAGYVKKASKEVSRTILSNRGEEEVVVMADFVEATVSGKPRLLSNRSIYPNSPSLTISGERDPKMRRIVVD